MGIIPQLAVTGIFT